jgi:signal transduction histidine kinase
MGSGLLRSTSVRLALGYAVLFILFSFTLVGFLWWRTAAYLDREVDAVILADARAVGDRLHDFGLPGAIETIKERVGHAVDEHAIYLLTDPTLTPIAGNLDAWPLEIGRRPGWHQIELAFQGKLHATRFLYAALPAGFQLLVGRDVEDRVAISRAILNDLTSAALLAILLAGAGGLLVRRAILRRVDVLNHTTTAIISGDLSSRLPTQGSSDEFDRLAQTINVMLQQIELLVDGVRHASNALAHDLRTPLAELRGRLEALQRVPAEGSPIQREIGGAVADLDRVIAIFNALLRLAEIDSGARLSGFRTVALDQILAEVVDLYGPLAEEKGVTVRLEIASDLMVSGDPFLLAQAVGNLVDNAVKYSRAGGIVRVAAASRGDDEIDITVGDQGPGIADDEKPHATLRFYRGRASRGSEGSGLGLSLVAAVARLHDGSLTLEDADPGLVARLSLAKARQNP